MGASGASAPPANITSARASRIAWNASPTAIVPEAQLIALVELGPVKPNSIAMLQLAAPGNTASASAGSSPRGPALRKPPTCASANATPPSAEPIIAPTRSQSSRAGASSASASANRALMTASCEKRSSRLARFASRWSWGRKSGISAAMRLRKGVGSKRVSSRTAERRATRPAHKPSTAVPIGVTAPTPVITTRRPEFVIVQARSASLRSLHVSFDPRQRPRRDPVDEHGPDHEIGREPADHGPWGTAPIVQHGHEHVALGRRRQMPQYGHAARDTPHVAVADLPRRRIDHHLGDPPRRIAQRAERAPRRHFDQTAPPSRPPLVEPHPAIIRHDLGPALDVRGRLEHPLDRRVNGDAVSGAHAASMPPPPGTPGDRSRPPGHPRRAASH